MHRLASSLALLRQQLSSSRRIVWTPSHVSRGAARWAPALFHTMATLQKAVVRSLPGEPNMTITLTVGGKQRNMDRPKDELLEKPLGRLQKSAATQPDKQQRRQKGRQAGGAVAADAKAADPPLFVGLHAGPSPEHPVLDAGAVTNEEAWRHGRVLRIGEEQYQVDLNPPLLDRVEVHGHPFVGIPLVPVVQLHFADEDACQWKWLRRLPGSSYMELVPGATSRRYTPCSEDVTCLLRVECTPGRRTTAAAAAAAAAAAEVGDPMGGGIVLGVPGWADTDFVDLPPTPSSAFARHRLTEQPTAAPQLRVVTYNILADQYAATDTAKNVIFAHCPLKFLNPDYRRPLVLAELLGFNADVICLQEVDEKMFTAYLAPQLAMEGFQGVYTNKAGKPGLSVREGSATFFRTSRFSLLSRRSLTLKDFFPAKPGDQAKYSGVFAGMLRSSPALQHALQRIATIAQLSLLVPVQSSDRPLCVLNTHLFYHYMAPHIRTMHVWAMLQEAQQFIDEAMADAELAGRLGGQRPSLLFCGDMNSDLNDGIPGAIELLAKGQLPANFWDWQYGLQFKWVKGEEVAEGGDDAQQAQRVQQAAAGAAALAAAPGSVDTQPLPSAICADEWGEVQKQVHSAVEHAHVRQPDSPASLRTASTSSAAATSSEQQVQAQQQAQQEAEFVAGVELASPFRLRPADGLCTPFTNHVKGYRGLLDYIWFDPAAMDVVREIPLPSLSELGGYLPNKRFPSDHLPVVFDLRFRGTSKDGSSSDASSVDEDGSTGLAAGGGGAAAGGGPGGGKDGARLGGAAASHVLPSEMYNVGVAVEALRQDEVVALPTDTLYGLAACANSSEAVRRIYTIKRRGDHKPLAIAVADIGDVEKFADVQHLPQGLLEELLPGPVTLLLRRRHDAPLAAELNPGLGTIGIRIPAAPFIRAVCRQHRSALALTSANISGSLSSIGVAEFKELWPACSLVFDGGQLDPGRSGSTVIDLMQPRQFCIARQGAGFARSMQLLQDKYKLHHLIE